MKLIQCIVRQEKLPTLIQQLSAIVPGMTVYDVRGHGRQGGHTAVYRGVEYTLSLLPKAMIEIVIEDNKVEDIVKVVTENARTGEIGDGRIFVSPVESAYHVRTGFMELD